MRTGPRDIVRVASVPASHPYVSGIGLSEAGVWLLADEALPGSPPGRWWPPAMLTPEWIDTHRHDFDLMHVHFGMESFTTAELGAAVRALRAAGRPLVHTVHDLTHPQLDDQTRHIEQLDLIVPAADALITLTPGAADEIARRWGRRAEVILHPAMRSGPIPVVPPDGSALIGTHLRDLRPGIDGPGTVDVLRKALTILARRGVSARARVHMHDRARDDAAGAEVAARCGADPAVELVIGPRPGDRALEAQVCELAVSLLPYRHGTHSGWVEMCWDLGVPVVVPAIGYHAEQHPEPRFCRSFRIGDASSLADALEALLSAYAAPAATSARRATQAGRRCLRLARQPEIASAHLAVYRRALG